MSSGAGKDASGNKRIYLFSPFPDLMDFYISLSRYVCIKDIRSKDVTLIEGRKCSMSRIITYSVPDTGGVK